MVRECNANSLRFWQKLCTWLLAPRKWLMCVTYKYKWGSISVCNVGTMNETKQHGQMEYCMNYTMTQLTDSIKH